MTELEIRKIVDSVEEYVGGGIADSLDSVLEAKGYPTSDQLPKEVLEAIDLAVFQCEQCDWLEPKDQESATANLCDDCFFDITSDEDDEDEYEEDDDEDDWEYEEEDDDDYDYDDEEE